MDHLLSISEAAEHIMSVVFNNIVPGDSFNIGYGTDLGIRHSDGRITPVLKLYWQDKVYVFCDLRYMHFFYKLDEVEADMLRYAKEVEND